MTQGLENPKSSNFLVNLFRKFPGDTVKWPHSDMLKKEALLLDKDSLTHTRYVCLNKNSETPYLTVFLKTVVFLH